ncbi:NUDIX domain-containing protein [Kitasatospora cineracea]|uniref:NUDIX domain-containing protein n=1 Tax=Kitasatospora cineracea TaxID=88074 RepID=UPI0036DDB664
MRLPVSAPGGSSCNRRLPVPVDREPGILSAVDGPLTRGFLRLPAQKSANPLASPGGHVDKGERALAAAVRELHEETGVLVDAADLVFVGVYDAPDRDPRGRYVGVAYLARVPADTQARAGDDAASVHWLQPEDMPEQVAFDHRLVVTDALSLVSEH